MPQTSRLHINIIITGHAGTRKSSQVDPFPIIAKYVSFYLYYTLLLITICDLLIDIILLTVQYCLLLCL